MIIDCPENYVQKAKIKKIINCKSVIIHGELSYGKDPTLRI